MQDLRSTAPDNGIGEGRRQRPHPPPAVKCPRCESLNTKFCYYNNYNLSQPRHFCKSCRRYWTKGGVLRNVPVGGGCRKTKRSSSSKPKPEFNRRRPDPKPDITPPVPTPLSSGNQLPVDESFGQPSDPAGFPAILGGFGFGDLAGNSTVPFEFEEKTVEEMKMVELTEGFCHRTVDVELESGGGNRGLTALDWESNGDLGPLDLTGGVDQGYWSRSQWEDDYQSLCLPLQEEK